jgi:hypothetical protein
MLMFDSHWMPLATPETAETTKAAVSTAMTPTSTAFPVRSSQPRICTPEPICNAPRPSEAAEPNRVAKIARPSISLPIGPSVRLPSNGAKAELISCERPRRKVP